MAAKVKKSAQKAKDKAKAKAKKEADKAKKKAAAKAKELAKKKAKAKDRAKEKAKKAAKKAKKKARKTKTGSPSKPIANVAAPEPVDQNVTSLRALARERGIPGYSRMSKEALLEALGN